jgi:uroporphyrinogen III methyltransferase/synthase
MAPARLPLTGQKVLVTRVREQASSLTDRLREAGASVVHLPAIEIVPADPAPLDAAIQTLDAYDWIVFTSANTVTIFAERLATSGRGADVGSARVAAVGSATAAALRSVGLPVDLIPDQFVAEAVVEALVCESIDGKRVLLPQAEIARETLATGLREAGAVVDAIVAYRTVMPDGIDTASVQALLDGVGIATFASPSSVRNLAALAGGCLPHFDVVCIGPITAAAAREAGLNVVAVAETHTADCMVETLVRYVEQHKEGHHGDRA